MKVMYESDDGRYFESEEACMNYEKRNSPEEIEKRKDEVKKAYHEYEKAFSKLTKLNSDFYKDYGFYVIYYDDTWTTRSPWGTFLSLLG